MAFDPETNLAFAGVIVYRLPELEEVERRMARRKLRFPYVPGLLSFRESPVLLAAFARLRVSPDVILIDGHGRAHPRRFGIACHLGLLLDRPTIGCAKSILVGEAVEPGAQAGSTAPLVDKGEKVGVVLRTREKVRPIYVTVGHRVSLESAVRIVAQCLDGFRIPKTDARGGPLGARSEASIPGQAQTGMRLSYPVPVLLSIAVSGPEGIIHIRGVF